MSRGRRAYNRVSDGADDTADDEAPLSEPTDSGDIESQPTDDDEQEPLSLKAEEEDDDDDDDNGDRITIVVMDPAQNKFDISVNPAWTVARFKKVGVTVHKIAVTQQRLIFMGRLLADETVLQDAKIAKDGVIVHLFPKPRVVVQNSSTSGDENPEEAAEVGGAHVPQIVLDADEAQMRSQILVLGSAEILDAQNNVKLLSFLLLIITSMELLALFTIMLGVPQNGVPDGSDDANNNTDDIIHHDGTVRTWRNSDYFDLALNLFGFYSAMLGIKATTENTRRLAKEYLICTVVCGILWNIFYYYLNYQVERTIDAEEHKRNPELPSLTQQDYLVQAFFAILIPMMIWFMCCMRAWQFHHLLEEAELEAEERIQSELTMNEEDGDEEGGAEGTGGVIV